MTGVKPDERSAADGSRAEEPGTDGEGTAGAAEELAGRLAGWVARTLSHAREEAEDVWADAQELRRRW
jgi:hypothetical protein